MSLFLALAIALALWSLLVVIGAVVLIAGAIAVLLVELVIVKERTQPVVDLPTTTAS